MNERTQTLVPEQIEGVHNKTTSRVKCASVKQAEFLFIRSAKRLLNINKWHHYSGKMLSHFCLTDQNGDKKNDFAQENDHIVIDIPGPGSKAGEGQDWVRIEAIKYEQLKDDAHILAMRVRPTQHPKKTKKKSAHFFNDDATSTFLLIHDGTDVSCSVVGRNEKPNLQYHSIADKIRNFFTALVAMSGFSKLQWKSLTKGILCTN